MSRPEDDGAGGFLGRWARRKQEVKLRQGLASAGDENLNRTPLTSVSEAAENAQESLERGTAEQPTATEPLPLPSLDDILPGTDVTAFFAKHVPEALRTAALRKLWITDPEIRSFIEMADYQWDFTNPDSIPGWSSKLEGVDVKAMVERIFNAVPPRADAALLDVTADTTAKNPAGTDEPAAGGHGSFTDYATNSSTSAQPLAKAGDPVIQNGAMQDIVEESIAYETVRKRHGGALPT
jgi:Protein of unknown function (DUF3306)